MTAVISADGIGYGIGSGGTVTQLTSKATSVTLNKPCGQITMSNAALAAGASAGFAFYNSNIAITDNIIIQLKGGTFASIGTYQTYVDYVQAGFCFIFIKNISAGSLSEAVGINFSIIKGVTS